MAHWQVVNSRPNFLSFLGLYEGRLKKYWHLDFIFCIVIKSHWRVLLSGSHNMFNPLKLQEDHILTLCNVKSGIKMEHVNSFNLSMLILFCFAFRLENSFPFFTTLASHRLILDLPQRLIIPLYSGTLIFIGLSLHPICSTMLALPYRTFRARVIFSSNY